MSTNMYGDPITQEVLLEIPEYATKARLDRAEVARRWKNKDSKYEEVVRYVKELKDQAASEVSTLCIIYNATEGRVELVDKFNSWGYFYETNLPNVIENEQWGGFLHVKAIGPDPSPSEAAVVYRSIRKDGEDADWMLAWYNPGVCTSNNNKAYAEIHEAGYCYACEWNTIKDAMESGVSWIHKEWEGCIAHAEMRIESDTCSPIYEAMLTIE